MVVFNLYRRVRQYKSLPVEERLHRWLVRVDRNTRNRFPRPRSMFLPQRLVELFKLPDNVVILYADGSLWHHSREEALARI